MDHAMPPLVLALDFGTSSVRSLIFNHRGDPIPGTESQREVELITTADGGVEIDPDELIELAFACLDETMTECSEPVAAVGISCFWHSLLGIDRDGQPTTPILMYSDTRSAADVDDLKTMLNDDEVHDRTGCRLHSSYWPSKLRWLKRTRPDAFAQTDRWIAFSDYLLLQMHGFQATAVPMAAATGMMDVRKAVWDPAMIRAAGVSPETLPPIRPFAAIDSSLAEQFAERWPGLINARWFPGVGDGACANIGAGAVSAERIALTVGTTGALRVLIQPDDMARLEIPADVFAYRIDEHSVLLGAAISNGGKLMAWLSELTGAELDGPEMETAADRTPDGHGLTLLPFLAGERSPLWNDRVTGVIAGLTLHTDRADLLRAGLESVAYRLARLHQSVGEAAAKPHEIIANGAAILRSPAWQQIMADSFNHDIRTLPETAEASARGAAVLALRGLGAIADLSDVNDPAASAPTVAPNPAHAAIYARAIARQTTLETLLYPSGAMWSD
jgi:gluconokinase